MQLSISLVTRSTLAIFFFVLFSVLHTGFCASGKVSVEVSEKSVFRNIDTAAVGRIVRFCLKDASFSWERAQVVLKGTSKKCDLHFDLKNGSVGGIAYRKCTGRVPVGNLYLLMKDALDWPSSVIIKDLVVTFPFSSIKTELLPYGVSDLSPLVFGGDAFPLSRELGKALSTESLVRKLYGCGVSLSRRRGEYQLSLVKRDAELLCITFDEPGPLNDKQVLFGRLEAVPGGRVMVRASFLLSGNRVLWESPEVCIAEQRVGKAFAGLQEKISGTSRTVLFPLECKVNKRTAKLSGIAVANLLNFVTWKKAWKWKSKRPSVEPTILLNPYH